MTLTESLPSMGIHVLPFRKPSVSQELMHTIMPRTVLIFGQTISAWARSALSQLGQKARPTAIFLPELAGSSSKLWAKGSGHGKYLMWRWKMQFILTESGL